jgi:hypothetical protein
MGKVLNNKDFNNNEIQNAKLQPVASDPGSLAAGNAARTWYNTTQGLLKVWNGTGADTLTNLLETVAPADAAVTVAVAAKNATIGVAVASGTQRGTMSTAHYSLLAGATPNNTPSTLMQRDASGNVTVATITGALTGTATNAAALGGATLTQVRDFSLTTGARDHTAINDFDTQVRLSRLDLMAPPTAAVSLNGQALTNVADPATPQAAATKNYVDNVASGLDAKASVRLATAGAALPANTRSGNVLTASGNGALTIDGLATAINNRVLVRNEATGANNGLYVVTDPGSAGTPWILTRSTDADVSTEVTPGLFTFVEEGNTMAASSWVLSTAAPITLNTTALSFAQFSGGGTYLNGNGLNLTGSVFSVLGTANRISVSGSGVDIAATYVGQTSITTLGTVATGTWQGSTIGVAYGGTGSTTAAGAKTALGFKTGNAIDVPAGSSYTWSHGLGTADIVPICIEKSTGNVVDVDFTAITSTQLTVSFGAAVAASAYRLVAIG